MIKELKQTVSTHVNVIGRDSHGLQQQRWDSELQWWGPVLGPGPWGPGPGLAPAGALARRQWPAALWPAQTACTAPRMPARH